MWKFLFLIVVGAGIYFFVTNYNPNSRFKDYQAINYDLNGRTYRLLVADTEVKRETGLMYIKELEGYDGMIFVFPKMVDTVFWNKNTYMDLTVYWLQMDQVVGTSDLPSLTKSKDMVTVQSPVPVDKVIEIPKPE